MAIDNDLLGLNPCRKLKWGRGQTVSRRERVLSLDEEARLMPQLERFPETRRAVILALNTGLRRMEIVRLHLRNLDMQERTLSYLAKGNKARTIPLNPDAFACIKAMLETTDKEGFLFHQRTGHNLSASSGAFQSAVKRAEIKDLHFHDLRHTFSTRVRAYTDAFTVRDLMGHSDVKTTDIT